MSIRARRAAFTTIALLWTAAIGLAMLTGVEFALRAQHAEPQASDPRYRDLEAAYLPFTVQHLHPNYLFWFPFDPAQRQALNNPVCSLSPDGFRGPGPTERGTRKLAYVLGGSAAFGHFASRNETTITGYLNARQDAYLFVNAGVPSWNSTQELQRLALELVAHHPALIIAYDASNDSVIGLDYVQRGRAMPPGAPESFDELSDLVDDIRGRPRPTQGSLPRRLFPQVMGLVDEWRAGGALESPPGETDTDGETAQETRELTRRVVLAEAKTYVQNISTMALLTKAAGARFIGVFQPVLPLHAHRPLGGPCDRDGFQQERALFRQAVLQTLPSDIEYYDLAALFDQYYATVPRFCFQGREPLVDQVFVDAVHLFDPGNQIVAEELWNRVQSRPRKHDTN